MIPSERKNDIFIVGDPHQRIYGHKVVLSQCGINIKGRSRKLRINYRTTEQIRQWATSILEEIDFDDLDGNLDDLKDYRSLLTGESPIIKEFNSFSDEVNFLATNIKQLSQNTPLASICLVVRTNQLVDRYHNILKEYDIPTHKIEKDKADDQSLDGLRVATMHRVKGLQFEFVFLASINQEIIPLKPLEEFSDQTAKANFLQQERSLIHVAATRAKQGVTITYYGHPSSFLA
jgi:superfamily I DNA/RNA helicase